MQIAGGACSWDAPYEQAIEVHSYEQHPNDLKAMCRERLRFEAKTSRLAHPPSDTPFISIEVDKSYRPTEEAPIDDKDTPLKWARRLAARLNRGEGRRRLVVVDGLNVLTSEQRHTIEIEELVSVIRAKALVGILVFESGGADVGGIVSQADVVIQLSGQETEVPPRYFLNRLSIVKARFQQNVLGWHQYKITSGTGVTVFPSLHYRTHRVNLLENRLAQSKVPLSELRSEEERLPLRADKSVLTHLIGVENFKRGSCTVVLGPRRTWKTQLTLDFLRAGSSIGQPGLLISLLDNQGTIIEQRPCLCERYCVGEGCDEFKRCYEQVFLFHFRPGCLAPGEFFHYLERRLNERAEGQELPIQRLTFWDLTQLESRFPLLANDRVFLAGLMDYLKHSRLPSTSGRSETDEEKRMITSVYMGAANKELAQAASAMADNVVFCWRDRHVKLEREGIAFYVDRIEGEPGVRRLAFLSEADKTAAAKVRPVTDIHELLTSDCKENDLPYAQSMIEEIRNLQGLPARRLRTTRSTRGSK
jgi:KaiC/GvpD/RAD55 family RecA-like ATPase